MRKPEDAMTIRRTTSMTLVRACCITPWATRAAAEADYFGRMAEFAEPVDPELARKMLAVAKAAVSLRDYLLQRSETKLSETKL
jgi:hypothetical protein